MGRKKRPERETECESRKAKREGAKILGEREDRMTPVTFGSHPRRSISISSSLSSPSHHTLPLPLFIFLLKCSNFYGLGENG